MRSFLLAMATIAFLMPVSMLTAVKPPTSKSVQINTIKVLNVRSSVTSPDTSFAFLKTPALADVKFAPNSIPYCRGEKFCLGYGCVPYNFRC